MGLHGISSFKGGVTTLVRVSPESPAALARCSGYKIEGGHLEPDGLVSEITGTPLTGTTPEQSPFAFMDGSTLKLLVRDSTEAMREMSGTAWGVAGGVVDVLPESLPCRLGRQVVFPTGGADAKLMAYEPGSSSTKLRPLSFKSPADYVNDAKPTCTPSAAPGLQLFDVVVTTGEWAQPVPTKGTVSNAADVATFTILDACTAGVKLFTKDLGGTGVLLNNKEYLLMDVYLADDPQNYATYGLFANDPTILPSGYVFALYSDQACTTEICTLRIPRIESDGLVHRIAFRLPSTIAVNTHVKGLGILTDAFFNAPASGSTFTMKLYSDAFDNDWKYKGNFLMPAIQWHKSPWAQKIEQVVEGAGTVTVAPANNLIANGGFESDAGGVPNNWTLSLGGWHTTSNGFRSGAKSLQFDMRSPSLTATSDSISITGGKQHTIEAWSKGYDDEGYFQIIITPTGGGAAQTYPGVSSYFFAKRNVWSQHVCQFTADVAATSFTVQIKARDMADQTQDFFIDDVAVYQSDQTVAGSAWVLQTLAEAKTGQSPANHLVKYAYAFAGKSILGSTDYALMVSNPSDASSPSVVADPWRQYTVAIALPVNAGGNDVMDDYASYVTHALIYRAVYDGSAGVWSDFEFVMSEAIAASISWLDEAPKDERISYVCNDLDVQKIMEVTNDYASSARYAVVSEGRVYAGCLDWDNDTGAWKRPTAIQVSSYKKPWAYPTTADSDSLVTDGSELDGYAVTGSEIRGLIARNDEKFVFLDNEFFLLRGDNPLQGWQFIRLDSIGCVSSRTLADCRSMLIWHNGAHFYRYAGGLAEEISKYRIDSTLIDWTKPHNAVYCDERYILFCEYDSEWSLLIYDLSTGGWRIRQSDALNLVGICAQEATRQVYGITPGGEAVNLFGSSTSDFGASSTVREVWTQFLVIASPAAESIIRRALFEVVSGSAVDIELEFNTHGLVNANPPVTRTLSVDSTRTRYWVDLNLQCDAVQIKATYTGTTPPSIYYMGVDDEPGAR